MTGRHRRPARRTMSTRAVGVIGVASLGVPLTSGAALAATPAVSPVDDGSADRTTQTHQARGERVIDVASNQEGDPYVYGGDGPHVFDCSGLSMFAYDKVGVDLPHNAEMQQDQVDRVAKTDKQRGDLIFFEDDGEAYHVGIYAGEGEIWAAPKTGETVSKEEIWTDDYTVGRPD